MTKRAMPKGEVVTLNGAAVRAARKAKRLTQEELGQRTELSKAWISAIENDNAEGVSIDTAQSIAAALGVVLDELMHQDAGPGLAPRSASTSAPRVTGSHALHLVPGDSSVLPFGSVVAVRQDTQVILEQTLRAFDAISQLSTTAMTLLGRDPAEHQEPLEIGIKQTIDAALIKLDAPNEQEYAETAVTSNGKHSAERDLAAAFRRYRIVPRQQQYKDNHPQLPGTSSDTVDDALVLAYQLYAEGRTAQTNDNYRDAQRALDQAGEMVKKIIELDGRRTRKSLQLYVKTQIALISNDYHQGELQRAIGRVLENLREMGTDSVVMPGRVRFLVRLAELYNLCGWPKKAGNCIQEGWSLLESDAWPKRSSQTYLRASLLHTEGMTKDRLGDWTGAARGFSEALDLARKVNIPQRSAALRDERLALEAYIRRDRCRFLIRKGDLDSALEDCEQSYFLRLKFGHGLRAKAHYYAHFADIYRSSSDEFVETLHNGIFDALEWFEAIGDKLDAARMYRRLSRLYRKRSSARDALYWAKRALEYGVNQELPFYEALAYRELGKAEAMESRRIGASIDRVRFHRRQAVNCLEKSIDLLAELGDVFELALSHRALGAAIVAWIDASTPAREKERAREHLMKACATFELLGATLELKKANKALCDLSKATE